MKAGISLGIAWGLSIVVSVATSGVLRPHATRWTISTRTSTIRSSFLNWIDLQSWNSETSLPVEFAKIYANSTSTVLATADPDRKTRIIASQVYSDRKVDIKLKSKGNEITGPMRVTPDSPFILESSANEHPATAKGQELILEQRDVGDGLAELGGFIVFQRVRG